MNCLYVISYRGVDDDENRRKIAQIIFLDGTPWQGLKLRPLTTWMVTEPGFIYWESKPEWRKQSNDLCARFVTGFTPDTLYQWFLNIGTIGGPSVVHLINFNSAVAYGPHVYSLASE